MTIPRRETIRMLIAVLYWITGSIVAIAAVVWVVLSLQPKPLLVNQAGFSQAVTDRNGHLIRLTLSSDEKYRLSVPLSEIPSTMIEATLLQEDAWFRWHPGVNPVSILRAFRTTYLGGSRRVGGSTITMQLARQRFGMPRPAGLGDGASSVDVQRLEGLSPGLMEHRDGVDAGFRPLQGARRWGINQLLGALGGVGHCRPLHEISVGGIDDAAPPDRYRDDSHQQVAPEAPRRSVSCGES